MIEGAQLEEGERLLFHGAAPLSKYLEPFEAAVSDRAVYVVGKRAFAVRNAFVVIRIPHAQVERVEVQAGPRVWLLWLSAIMVAVGGFTTFVMFRGIIRGEGGMSSGIPVGVLVVGAVLPWASRGRRRLVIRYGGRKFSWEPRVVVDAASRNANEALLKGFLASCREAGLHVAEQAG